MGAGSEDKKSGLTERLGEYLVKSEKITEKQLTAALERQVIMGGRLGTNLIEMGVLTEEDLLQFLSKKLNIPPVQPDELENIEPALTQLISRETAEKYCVVPIKLERKTLSVALMDPVNLDAINELRFITGYAIRPFIASEARVRYVLERYYQINRGLRYVSILDEERKKHGEEDTNPTVKMELTPEEMEGALKQAKEDWVEVRDRDEAASTLLRTANLILDRGILFQIKSDSVTGWKAFPSYREPEITPLRFHLKDLPLFKEVSQKKSGYQGPPPTTPVFQEVVQALGGSVPVEILVAPILINDEVVAILYGDNRAAGLSAPSREFIQKLLHKFAMALGILILKKKILEL